MRLWLAALFLVLAFIGPSQSATTYPTCAYFGLKAPCFNSAIDFGDPMVNVRVFGAKGDGVTDDTAAFQACIDYAYNNKVHACYCPSGDYLTSGTIYLDPPGNLRANFANPPLFSFSLSLIGTSGGIGNDTGFGCTIHPNFNNKTALLVGSGQHMTVRGIAVISSVGGYRGNQPTAGIGIGIAGGNGGASEVLIENTHVENFNILYYTNANSACCLSDSVTFRKVSGINGAFGIGFNGSQADVNDVIEATFGQVTTVLSSTFSRQVTVTGGNLSPTAGKNAAFSISATSALSRDAGTGTYSFTTTIASPDIYIPSVYNSCEIVAANLGVIPLTLVTWNSGTSVMKFKIDPPWSFGLFGVIAPFNDLTSGTDLSAEIQAATKVYCSERTTIAAGQGISMEGVHFETPGACQTLYSFTAGFQGATISRLREPFFNSDPARPDIGNSLGSMSDANKAQFYCNQVFPFIYQDSSSGASSSLIIDGADFGSIAAFAPSAPLLLELGPTRTVRGATLHQWSPPNLIVWDSGGQSFSQPGAGQSRDQNEDEPNGAGEWDSWYTLPRNFFDSFQTAKQWVQHGNLTTPMYGYHAAYGTEPNLSADIYGTVSGTLGALGAYPPIDCITIYKSVEWNDAALTHIFKRSAHCPGWSYGQNLDDSTVGSSHGSFTGAISNGAGGAGTQLVVTGISGSLGVNDELTDATKSFHTYITVCPGGGCNTNGTYTVANSLNIASETMTSYGTQVTWSHKGASPFLYLDSKTLGWVFPGLGFTLSDGINSDNYIITGVYPQLGYVTVFDTTGAQFGGTPFLGTKTTVYSCSVKCSIGQAAYSWSQYP